MEQLPHNPYDELEDATTRIIVTHNLYEQLEADSYRDQTFITLQLIQRMLILRMHDEETQLNREGAALLRSISQKHPCIKKIVDPIYRLFFGKLEQSYLSDLSCREMIDNRLQECLQSTYLTEYEMTYAMYLRNRVNQLMLSATHNGNSYNFDLQENAD